MGQATMSNQSPQTGGKTGQYGQPGQAGGKGFGGGGFKPEDSSLTQNVISNLQNTPPQADGNMGMSDPLPFMGDSQQTKFGASPQATDRLGPINNQGSAGGKGMAGTAMNAIPQQQQMSQSIPQQADGNMKMGAPLPPMGGPMQSMVGSSQGMQQTNPGGDMYGSGVGQSTNPQQAVGASGSSGAIGQGMGQGNVTYPSQNGQPMMGMPNQYSNTVGQPGQGMEEGSAYQGTGSGKNASSGKGAGNSSRSSGA
jgi:hypothetical protein